MAWGQHCSAQSQPHIPVLTWILSTCQHVGTCRGVSRVYMQQYRRTIALLHCGESAMFSPDPCLHTCVDLDTLNMSTCGQISFSTRRSYDTIQRHYSAAAWRGVSIVQPRANPTYLC